jgi:ribonuclease HI
MKLICYFDGGFKCAKKEMGLSSIEIYGDCKNLIDQMNKESKVKPPHLKEVYIRCLEKIDQLDIEDISFSWISRENNNACDRLMR